MESKSAVRLHLPVSEPPSRRGSINDEGHNLLPSSARGSLVGDQHHERHRCGKGRERALKLCTGGAKMLGATLTGALAGGAFGCASFNPVGVAICAGVGGLSNLVAHLANDPEGAHDNLRNQVGEGIRNTLGGMLGVAETGVLSAGFGARFAVVAELEDLAREMGLDESQAAIMVGFAGAAATVGWTMGIGGAVGLAAIAARAGKELINLPGAMAGTPLRIPADSLKELAVCILCTFATANVQAIRDAASVASGDAAGQLGPFPFEQSLAPPDFQLSTAMTSSLVAASGAMVALCLYVKDGGAWKDMPVSNRQELKEFAAAQLREKMHGAVYMAATSPLTSIFRMELPDRGSLKVLGEMLKLVTSPAAMFGFYAAYMEHLSQHPGDEGASAAAAPAFFAGGILFSTYWLGLLMKWGMGKTPEALDLVDATPRTPYTDVQRAAIMCVGVLAIALATDSGMDEASPDRGLGQESAFALALMMGFFGQLAARLGNPQHTMKQAREGYAGALAGFTTGALNGGVPAALAVTGATLFEQAAGLLYDWSQKQHEMERVTQAAVQAQEDERAMARAPGQAAAELQEAAMNARIEEETRRRTAQALADWTGQPLAAVEQMMSQVTDEQGQSRGELLRKMMESVALSPMHSRIASLSVDSAVFDTPRRRATSPNAASPRAFAPYPDDSD